MKIKNVIRLLLLVLGYLILIFGIYSGILLITGEIFTVVETLLVCALPILAIYSFIFYPIVVIAMVRLHRKKSKVYLLPVILGITILVFNFLPFAGISSTVAEGDAQFEAVFGTNYMDQIPNNLTSKFKTQPFNLWDMFNNYQNFNCNITYNCGPYLTDPVSNDSFYFDFYCPTSGSGPFPTIINIHGGAWVIGNKGTENRPIATKYLAQQGYVVFDIQYGLAQFPEDPLSNDVLTWVQTLLGREMLNKSYTLSEIAVQVLGNFTDYLATHAAEYKVDTNRIYVTGNSAGAHIAGLFLGYNSTYKQIFNDTLKLKGLILFYCPSNLTHIFNYHIDDPLGQLVDIKEKMIKIFGGTPENNASLFNNLSPVYLVDEWAPPCLILHGQSDKLVPYVEGVQLYNKLQSAGRPVVFLRFPFQGHAFDYSFNSPGGQVAMYYMERFLAATQYCL